MPCTGQYDHSAPSFYAPSFALSRYACGWYGVGHTAWREPGDMRGTVVGRKGRFKFSAQAQGVVFTA